MLFPASGVIKLSYEGRSINYDRPTEIPTSNLDTRRGGHREWLPAPPRIRGTPYYACTLSIIILGKTGLYFSLLLSFSLPLYLAACMYALVRTHENVTYETLLWVVANVWKCIPNLPWPVSPGSAPTAGRLPFFFFAGPVNPFHRHPFRWRSSPSHFDVYLSPPPSPSLSVSLRPDLYFPAISRHLIPPFFVLRLVSKIHQRGLSFRGYLIEFIQILAFGIFFFFNASNRHLVIAYFL